MIEVSTRPFEDILLEYGVPYYLKVDIEGADHYCIEALNSSSLPKYLSFEKDQLGDLFTARNLGYTRFKIIYQENFSQFIYTPGSSRSSDSVKKRVTTKINQIPGLGRIQRLLKKVKKKNAQGGNLKKYAYGSSGPFGEETDGPWRSFEEVAFTWLAFDMGFTDFKNPVWEDWFDIHCAR